MSATMPAVRASFPLVNMPRPGRRTTRGYGSVRASLGPGAGARVSGRFASKYAV